MQTIMQHETTNDLQQLQGLVQYQGQTEDVFHSNELIAKIVINKIINLSLRETYVKDIDDKMNDYYYNYVKNDIDICAQLTFINIDSEDINTQGLSSPVNPPANAEDNTLMNTWIEINEPSSSHIDTYASSLIKAMHVRDPSYSPIKIYQDDDENNKINEAYDKKFSVFCNSNPSESQSQAKTRKDKERDKLGIDITPAYQINELQPIEDNEEVIELRIEKQLDLIRVAHEIKKQKEIEEKEKVALVVKEKVKPFDSTKFTFDSEGNVLMKKNKKNDNLSKEFYLIKHDIRDVRNDNSPRNKRPMIKSQQTEQVTHNPYANGEFFNTAIKTNNPFAGNPDKQSKLIIAGSNYDMILPEIGVRITEEKKTKGGEKEFSKKYKKTSRADYEKMLNESIPKLNSSFMKSKLMNTMSPNNNNQAMINLMNLNSSSAMDSTSVLIPTLTEGNISLSSYVNQSKTLNQAQNPLLNSVGKYNSNLPIQEYTMMDRSVNNMTMSLNLSKNSRLFSEEDRLIKMNRKLQQPLKMAMDSINDLELIDDNEAGHHMSLRKLPALTDANIFKSQTMKMGYMLKDAIQKEKDENILYCKSIVNTKDWGRTSLNNPIGMSDINKTMTFSKPSQGSLIRELGVQIVNTKEPRSRKYKHVLKKIQ